MKTVLWIIVVCNFYDNRTQHNRIIRCPCVCCYISSRFCVKTDQPCAALWIFKSNRRKKKQKCATTVRKEQKYTKLGKRRIDWKFYCNMMRGCTNEMESKHMHTGTCIKICTHTRVRSECDTHSIIVVLLYA